MAGRGPAPKDPGQRRRYNQPARGEWIDLEPLDEPVLGEYNPEWQIRRKMWDGWRMSAVTSQYDVEDIELIEELARNFYDLGESTRLRMIDSLGLSPKGKRDLRWRTPNEVKTIKAAEQRASVHRLRAVGGDK
jgi:hypothetical protein